MMLIRTLAVSSALALTLCAFGGPFPFPPNANGLHLETVVGSFKIKRGSEALNEGTCDISFTGTVLVSDLQGVAKPGPGVKLEYSRPDMQKQLFHGTGMLHVSGKFGGLLFFGRDMEALYTGTGVVQLYGEFDKKLNTGFYWYGADPSKKQFWGTFGQTIIPNVRTSSAGLGPKIKIKDVGGKG